MSGTKDRAAEVLAGVLAARGVPDARGVAREQVADFAAVGLLAPPPPRTWQAGDPEPDDVQCVMDRDGDVWQQHDRDAWWFGAFGSISSKNLLERCGPLTEVHLPGAPS